MSNQFQTIQDSNEIADHSRNELTQAQASLIDYINPTDAPEIERALKKAIKLCTYYTSIELTRQDLDDFLLLEGLVYQCKAIRKEVRNG
jgi:plasmid replication initiation protein